MTEVANIHTLDSEEVPVEGYSIYHDLSTDIVTLRQFKSDGTDRKVLFTTLAWMDFKQSGQSFESLFASEFPGPELPPWKPLSQHWENWKKSLPPKENESPLTSVSRLIPALDMVRHCPVHKEAPSPGAGGICTPKLRYPISILIMHLNDACGWTREQIADWLEALDVDLKFPTPNKEEE